MTRLTEQDAIVQAVADYNAGVTSSNNSLAGAGQIQRLVYQYMAAGVTTNPNRQTPIGRIMGYIYDNGFSPLSLFSAGEVGAWYDPSDFSSMFQDSAGTTPVTAVEQPVGLILDKSKGLVLGSERIVNGDFSNGVTGWATNNATQSVINGRNRIVNTTTGSGNSGQFISTVIGSTYYITFYNGAESGANLDFRVGTVSEGSSNVRVNTLNDGQTYTGYFVATATTTYITIVVFNTSATIGSYVEIDNISVKELSGNHASQATTTKRPVLKIDGNGKYYLLFDGVDDALATSAIDFSATDKMSVWAGANTPSPALAIFIELSVSATSNNGAFYLTDNESTSGLGTYKMRGDLTAGGQLLFNPPDLSVYLYSFDIANDLINIKVNGATATGNMVSGADAGAGNFGNYPLYIGGRATTSLFFSGSIYSLIIRGAASTAAQITNTEAWVATKTGVVI